MRTLQIILATTLGLIITTQAQQSVSATETKTQLESISNNSDKSGDTSVGLKWGDLTGVEFKHWYDQKNALVLGFAFDDGNTAIGVDYLWHYQGSVETVTGLKNTETLVPYIGVGIIGVFGNDEDTNYFDHNTDDFGLALHAPLGIEFLPHQLSLGVFAEIAPSFGFVPTTFTFLTANVGARYYF